MKTPVVTRNPKILGGTPVFSGTRVPVRILHEHLDARDGLDEFLDQFPSVSRDQAVQYMAQSAPTAPSRSDEVPP